jgi:hypothetical protein
MATDQATSGPREAIVVADAPDDDLLAHPQVTVDVQNPVPIKIAMVPVNELKALEQSSAEEQQASGFCVAFGSAAVSAILAALLTPPAGAAASIYWPFTFLFFVVAVWYAFTWRRARKKRTDAFAALFSDRTETRYMASVQPLRRKT